MPSHDIAMKRWLVAEHDAAEAAAARVREVLSTDPGADIESLYHREMQPWYTANPRPESDPDLDEIGRLATGYARRANRADREAPAKALKAELESGRDAIDLARSVLAKIPSRDDRDSMPEPPAAVDPPPRLTVCRKPPSITFDGNTYGVSDEQAAFVDVLVNHLGQWVAPDVCKRDPMLGTDRRDRIKKKLPPPIRKLIESKGGKGSRLTLP